MVRRSLALALIVALAPSCSGGSRSGSSSSGSPTNPPWVDIQMPFDGQVNVGFTPSAADTAVLVSGTSFVSPTWWSIGGASGSTAGVTVTWTNLTTGDLGTATCTAVVTSYGILGSSVTGNDWTAAIPVVPGPNQIHVVATDPSGLTASATSTLTPAPLAAVSPGTAGSAWNDWDDPLYVEKEAARAQWAVLASELTSAGLTPGAQITQVQLHVQGLADIPGLALQLQGGTWSTPTAFVSTGWTATAYPQPATGQSGSWLMLTPTSTFVWNGTDDLLFDLSRVGGGPGGPYSALLLRAGLTSRMVSRSGTAAESPFDGLPLAVWDSIPELRLSWE